MDGRREAAAKAPAARGLLLAVSPDAVAPVGRRVVAFLLDVAVLVLAAFVAAQVAARVVDGSDDLSAVRWASLGAAALVWVVQLVVEAVSGATLGQAVVGIRTVSARTGSAPGLLAVLVRHLVVAVGWLACLVGALAVVASGAWDSGPTLRGWHDKAAGTLVLRASARRSGGGAAAGGGAAPAPAQDGWSTARDHHAATASGPVRGPGPGPVPAPSAPPPAVLPAMPRPVPGGGTVPVPQPAPVPLRAEPPAAWVADASVTMPAAAPPDAADPVTTAPVPVPVPAPVPEPVPVPDPPAPDADPVVTPAAPSGGTPDPAAPAADGDGTQLIEVPADLWAGEPPTRRSRRDGSRGTAPTPTAPPTAPAWSVALPRTPGTPTGSTPAVPAGRPEPLELDDIELTRLRTPPEGQPSTTEPSSRPASPSRVRLVFDTGERVDVVGDGVVGRSPDPQAGLVHVVAIDDPDRSVSKVHLAFGPATGGVWVTDRGSTNGTVVVSPDGGAAVLAAGTRAEVGTGWTVRFGSRSFRVEGL